MKVTPGSTDVSTIVKIIDSADGTLENSVESTTLGLNFWYRRDVIPGSTPLDKVNITPVALASLTTAHTDGGIELIADGDYRLDLPDAAVASGAIGVRIGGTATDMIVIGQYIDLSSISQSAAIKISSSGDTIVLGTAQTGTLSTTQMSTDLAETSVDQYKGRNIIWKSGVLTDRAANISAYSATGVLTFSAVDTAPSNGDSFIIV